MSQSHQPRPWRLDLFTWAVDRPGPGGTTTTHALAGTGSRFMAALADLFLFLLLLSAAAAILSYTAPGRLELLRLWMTGSVRRTLLLLALVVFLQFVYAAALELLTRGRTPGKVVCGLAVVDQSGSRPGWGQLLVRNLLRPVDFLPVWYLLGGVLTTATAFRQRLGDLVARTAVIHTTPLRDMLARSATPVSAYSTSEDGYLLEATLARETHLVPQASAGLESRLASHLHRTYAPSDPFLRGLYADGNFAAYLRALYRQERSTETYDEVPSGVPDLPPPVDD